MSNDVQPVDDFLDERIIQAVIGGAAIELVARAHGVTIEYIDGLFQPPRFQRTPATVKALELARLDVATKVLMPDVESGDREAIATLLKVQGRRSRYLGLDMPTQADTPSQINYNFTYITAERAAILQNPQQAYHGPEVKELPQPFKPDERTPFVKYHQNEERPDPKARE